VQEGGCVAVLGLGRLRRMRDSGEVEGAMAALPNWLDRRRGHKCVPMDKAGRRAVRGVFEVLIVWARRSGPAASQRNH
jgi:hypothetical protein